VTWVYAGALAVGFVGVLALVARLGLLGRSEPMVVRQAVAGLTAFGIGGMSATFGGWSPLLAGAGAIVAAVAAAAYASVVGAD
jgi:hypothetical protein